MYSGVFNIPFVYKWQWGWIARRLFLESEQSSMELLPERRASEAKKDAFGVGIQHFIEGALSKFDEASFNGIPVIKKRKAKI